MLLSGPAVLEQLTIWQQAEGWVGYCPLSPRPFTKARACLRGLQRSLPTQPTWKNPDPLHWERQRSLKYHPWWSTRCREPGVSVLICFPPPPLWEFCATRVWRDQSVSLLRGCVCLNTYLRNHAAASWNSSCSALSLCELSWCSQLRKSEGTFSWR